jgi:hypothetical protein
MFHLFYLYLDFLIFYGHVTNGKTVSSLFRLSPTLAQIHIQINFLLERLGGRQLATCKSVAKWWQNSVSPASSHIGSYSAGIPRPWRYPSQEHSVPEWAFFMKTPKIIWEPYLVYCEGCPLMEVLITWHQRITLLIIIPPLQQYGTFLSQKPNIINYNTSTSTIWDLPVTKA